MKTMTCILVCSMACCVGSAQTPPAPRSTSNQVELDAQWQGVWQGKMRLIGSNKPAPDVSMTLEIKPIDDSSLRWLTKFGDGPDIIKDYKLVAVPSKPDVYELDEGNGVKLAVRTDGNVMHCQFGFGETLMVVRHELQGDLLRYELTAAKRITGVKNRTPDFQVDNFEITQIQAAELRRVRSDE
jgi:hypothetical protein